MPRTAKSQTPGAVLREYIDKYQINAFSLSKSLDVAYQSVINILNGKTRISVQMALRLAAYFGNSVKFWIDVQTSSEIDELSANKKFLSSIKKIPKAGTAAPKSTGKAKKEKKAKAGKKTKTLAEKRKKAAKAPGSKASQRAKMARGRKTGRPAKK